MENMTEYSKYRQKRVKKNYLIKTGLFPGTDYEHPHYHNIITNKVNTYNTFNQLYLRICISVRFKMLKDKHEVKKGD